jgi:4-hydroxy-tetrahydrodipicolinate reductase
MNDKLKVAIAGISGAMGQSIALACTQNRAFEIVACVDKADSGAIGNSLGGILNGTNSDVTISSDIASSCAIADVFIDFTAPEASLHALESLRATSVKSVIIGTTGFTPEQDTEVKQFSDRFVIVKSGNFSLGVNLLAQLVERASHILREDWDIEIVEAHHRRKVDAPSGTALLLGAAAASGRGKELDELRLSMREGISDARKLGGIGFSAIRGGGVIGEHDVRFESESESLVLSHKAHDRTIFAKGALAAAKWSVNKEPGLYTMRDVLEF